MDNQTPDSGYVHRPSPYVRTISAAVQMLHDCLTAEYGDRWRLRLERTETGFQAIWETYDAHGYGVGESFHITPAPLQPCDFACGWQMPYGFVPECGCPVHDPN